MISFANDARDFLVALITVAIPSHEHYIIGCFSTLSSIASISLLDEWTGAIVSAFFQKHRYTRYVPIIITAIGKSPFHQSDGQSPLPAISGAIVSDMILISLMRMFSEGPDVSNKKWSTLVSPRDCEDILAVATTYLCRGHRQYRQRHMPHARLYVCRHGRFQSLWSGLRSTCQCCDSNEGPPQEKVSLTNVFLRVVPRSS